VAGTVKLEKMGKPGVFITCDTFADDAKSLANEVDAFIYGVGD